MKVIPGSVAKYKVVYSSEDPKKMKIYDFDPLDKDKQWELVAKNFKKRED